MRVASWRPLLEVVDPNLEWTYLDPSLEGPQPQACHDRHELESALQRQAERGLRAHLEEAVGHGDRVMVGATVHQPTAEHVLG
jgi:hypothetical protein